MQICYLFDSFLGNKYAGYSHICRHKSRHRTTCGQSATVPASLQHQFTYQLATAGWDNSPILTYTEKLSKLVGKRLTLSYIPATQADADLIASYLPKPNADGSPIRPEQLPTSLPGYLINLKAQINLDGVAVATSSTALPMGTDLQSTGGFTKLSDPTQWDLTSEESNVVGQATAIGISAGGISAVQLTQLKDRLTTTKTQLEAKNFTGLTGEQISGDLLTATIWSWFAAAESHNRLSQNQANMIENQGLSYGLFHAIAQPVYSWGVIRKVTFPGVNMDISHVRPIGYSKDNDKNTWIAYNKLRGQYMSALEHAIPSSVFNDSNWCNIAGTTPIGANLPPCPEGVSAVKAIAIAASQGQKIYTITQEVYVNNPNIVSANLAAHSNQTRQAVQNALSIGHEVTIHESPITQSGWSGAGYTTIDPATGAGGYMIDGGSNGGVLLLPLFMNICAGFWSALWTNFVSTNNMIPGLALPAGVTLLTGSFVVDALGGITFLKLAMNWNALWALGSGAAGMGLVIASIIAMINFVLMSVAFEAGIFIGSAGVAANETCRK